MAQHNERFSQLAPLYELLDAKFRSDAAGKPVHILMEATSGAGKTTIISQYSEILGIKIKYGHVTIYEYLIQTKEFKAKGVCSLIHEDISKIHPERELLNIIPYWHMVADKHVFHEAFKPHVDEHVCIGLLLTFPNGFLDGRIYESMNSSGFMNRLLHIRFDSHKDVRRLLSQAIRNGNVHKTTIDSLDETKLLTPDEVEDLYGKEVYDLPLSGNQQSQIFNLLEHGCSLETIKMFLDGKLVFK